MEYRDNHVKDINIAYIGGGSRGWAWKLMSDLALEGQLSGTVKLYDIDYDAAYSNEIIGNKLYDRHDVKGKWKYKAVGRIEEALTGADFVIISILPGTFKEMYSDVHEPEKYGIYQPVGDTVGPGGLVRALRTIPMYVEIAENIKKYSPDAWVINYTNPMTLCMRTLYEVFPGIKAFGCCHEVFGTQELLADMVMEVMGIEDVKRDEIKVNVIGINHFTWLDRASYKGMGLFPMYRDFADKYYETGYDKGHDFDKWVDSYFSFGHRVKFDLFKRYGLIAAAGDRHLAEFMHPTYIKNPETARKWKFNLTPVEWRIGQQKMLKERSQRLVAGEEQVELRASGEEGIRQLKAILGLDYFVTNVNLPNYGQIKDVPFGSVVETNALFSKDSVTPIMAGKMPADVGNLVVRHVLNQETILKAALNRDKDMAFNAFINDPLVNIDIDDARKLFDTMLQNTKEYLPGYGL